MDFSTNTIIKIPSKTLQGQFADTYYDATLANTNNDQDKTNLGYAKIKIEDNVAPAVVKNADKELDVKIDINQNTVTIPFDRAIVDPAASEKFNADIVVEINGERIDHASGDYAFTRENIGAETNTGIKLEIKKGIKIDSLVIKTSSDLNYVYADNGSETKDFIKAFTFSKDDVDFMDPNITKAEYAAGAPKVVTITLDDTLYLVDAAGKTTAVTNGADLKANVTGMTTGGAATSAIYDSAKNTVTITYTLGIANNDVLEFKADGGKSLSDQSGKKLVDTAKFDGSEFTITDKYK